MWNSRDEHTRVFKWLTGVQSHEVVSYSKKHLISIKLQAIYFGDKRADLRVPVADFGLPLRIRAAFAAAAGYLSAEFGSQSKWKEYTTQSQLARHWHHFRLISL